MTNEPRKFEFPKRINSIAIIREGDDFAVMAGDEKVHFGALSGDDFDLLGQVQEALQYLDPIVGVQAVSINLTPLPKPVYDADLQAGVTAYAPPKKNPPAYAAPAAKKPPTNKGRKSVTTVNAGVAGKENVRIPFREPMQAVGQAADHLKEGRWCSAPHCGKEADTTERGINACPWHRAWLDELIARVDKKAVSPSRT